MWMDFLPVFADECLHQYYEIIPYFCQTAELESPWNSFLCLLKHPCVYK